MDQWIHKWIWDDKSGSCNCKVDEQVLSICGSMGCHRFGAYSGRAVHMKQDTPFLSISAIPDGVCFLVCVCMQFMHSRVNVFYWHMDAWILPYCYTWKSTGHIQTVEAFADVASGGVDATAGFYIQNVHWGCFPQDFSGTKASQLRYSMKHGMWWTLVDNLYCWWRCG